MKLLVHFGSEGCFYASLGTVVKLSAAQAQKPALCGTGGEKPKVVPQISQSPAACFQILLINPLLFGRRRGEDGAVQRWDQTWRGHLMFCELVGSSVIFSGIQLLGARARNQHFSHSCTERWTRAGLILIATVSRRAEVSANCVPQWQQKCQRQPRLIKGAGDTQTEGHVELAVSLSGLQEQRAVPAGDTLHPPLAVISLRCLSFSGSLHVPSPGAGI